MSGTGFVRIKKLTGAAIVLAAARHNRRAIQAEVGAGGSIDSARSHSNYRLAGPDSPEGVAEMASSRMKAAGLKLRKDAVRAIELVFSLPRGSMIDHRAYFSDCLHWAGNRFAGADNVLSADVHLDESAPHCHVLILPLVSGRMVGSDLVGGGKVFTAHASSFHAAVASRYGLRKAPVRQSAASRRALSAAVLQQIRVDKDPVLQSAVWALVRDAIERDPCPWAAAMDLNVEIKPAKPPKSMAAIFTGTGEGPKRESATSNPIRFATAANHPTLCSVGFDDESSLVATPSFADLPCVGHSSTEAEAIDAAASTRSATAHAPSDEVKGVHIAIDTKPSVSTVSGLVSAARARAATDAEESRGEVARERESTQPASWQFDGRGAVR